MLPANDNFGDEYTPRDFPSALLAAASSLAHCCLFWLESREASDPKFEDPLSGVPTPIPEALAEINTKYHKARTILNAVR